MLYVLNAMERGHGERPWREAYHTLNVVLKFCKVIRHEILSVQRSFGVKLDGRDDTIN